MSQTWMLYGANGYSGQLIAELAVQRGEKPILAGRNANAIYAMADRLGCEARVLDLGNESTLVDSLADIKLVLNCAGPFSETARPLLAACLQSHTHYLDLSGELAVFEHCYHQHERAFRQGTLICPGVALDVVPTESIALKLKQLMPNATQLKLGFDGKMALSPGSTLTLLSGIGDPELTLFMVRENGELKKAARPVMQKLAFAAGGRKRMAMSLTWADLNAAWYSTGIENIAVFVRASWFNRLSFNYFQMISGMLRKPVIQRMSEKAVKRLVKGPSVPDIENSTMHVFGEASNEKGETRRIDLTVPHGYKFTALSALAYVQFALSCSDKAGYFTPAQLTGPDFVQRIPGCSSFLVS